MTHLRRTLVVAGNGMVGHRFVQAAVERGLTETYDVVVVGEEPRPAYDRVALTSFFAAGSADELSLLPEGAYDDPRVRLVLGTTVTGLDRETRTVALSSGEVLAYDALVLATGAAPFVPPVPGRDLAGCFVYRTIEDLEAIRDASNTATRGVVIGGGLLGLEAANALVQLGLETHVVEMAPRLMPVQLDDGGGAALVRHIEKLGVTVHAGAATQAIVGDGRVRGAGDRGRHRSRPTWWSSRRASAPGTSWPATPASRSPSAAACWSTSSAAPPTTGSSRSASARRRAAGCTAWSRRATPWPRSSSTPCWTGRAPSPAPTCPPSSSCSASTSRPSATPSPRPRARWRSCTPTPWRASTRSSS